MGYSLVPSDCLGSDRLTCHSVPCGTAWRHPPCSRRRTSRRTSRSRSGASRWDTRGRWTSRSQRWQVDLEKKSQDEHLLKIMWHKPCTCSNYLQMHLQEEQKNLYWWFRSYHDKWSYLSNLDLLRPELYELDYDQYGSRLHFHIFILYVYLSKMQPVRRMSRFPVSQQLLEGILFKIRNWWSWILHIPNIFPCHMHSHIYLQYCKMQMRHAMLIVLVIMEQY